MTESLIVSRSLMFRQTKDYHKSLVILVTVETPKVLMIAKQEPKKIQKTAEY